MKKWGLIVVVAAFAIAIAGVTGLLPERQPRWTVETVPGTDLILSMDGSSRSTGPTKLQIRCNAGTAQLRLYVPVRVMPPAGQPTGQIIVDLREEFHDKDRKLVAGGSQERRVTPWVLASDGGYAVRPESATFINQLTGQTWLFVRAVGFRGDDLASSTIEFPLTDLANHKTRIASSCGAGS